MFSFYWPKYDSFTHHIFISFITRMIIDLKRVNCAIWTVLNFSLLSKELTYVLYFLSDFVFSSPEPSSVCVSLCECVCL